MFFDLPSLIVIWTALAMFVAAVGALMGWVAATAVSGNKRLIWMGAALSPVSWAVIYVSMYSASERLNPDLCAWSSVFVLPFVLQAYWRVRQG
jgi:Na+/melibiose symporter-like transporter